MVRVVLGASLVAATESTDSVILPDRIGPSPVEQQPIVLP